MSAICVVIRLTHLGLIVPVLFLSCLSDGSVLLFRELIGSNTLELPNSDVLYVASINQVIEVWVFCIAVDKVTGVHVFGFDSVLRVIISFYDSHAENREIINASSQRGVVEVIPLQRQIRGDLRSDLRRRLDVISNKDFGFF